MTSSAMLDAKLENLPRTRGEKFFAPEPNRSLLPLLLDLPPGRVLDCGCGTGNNARVLAERGWKVTGVTINPREAEVAAQWCEQTVIADFEDGLPVLPGKYDLVLLSHIIEHLGYPARLLNALREVVAPAGVVVMALPNAVWWPQRLQFLLGRFEYQRGGPMDDTHLRFYTVKTAPQLLRSHGYCIVRTVIGGSFPLPRVRKYLPKAVTRSLDRAACGWFPGFFGYELFYFARPE